MTLKPAVASLTTALASLLFAVGACNSRQPAPAAAPAFGHPIALSATSSPASAPTSAPASPAALAMKQSVDYLASDALEGRGIGTTGLDLAAAYIAGDFHGAGLHPLPGLTDYFQRFETATADGVAPETFLKISDQELKLQEQFVPLSFSAEKSFTGPAVFAGYGITSKEHNYDDYAGLDVKGKVVIAWRFEPVDKDGKSKFAKDDWSELAHLDTKAKNAADHGAAALILTNPPLFKGPADLLPFARQFQGTTAALPVFHLRPFDGEALLRKATGKDPKALQEENDAGPAPKSQALPDLTISGKVAIKRTVHYLQNVVGYLPGSGPHADEYVVIGAHYDHLGHGGPGSLAPKSKAIHHGADDNGSGSAALIELAHEFASRVQPLQRSLIFIAFTGEEEGLWGSSRFVNYPPVPLKQIVAMLNLDMVGRIRDDTLYVGGTGTAAAFNDILKEADKGSSLKIKSIGEGGLGPSDHMAFALKKVPVLFFFSGMHKDYHRPTDTADKINYNGMADVVALSARVIEGMAAMPRQQYVASADAHSMTTGMGSGPGVGGGGGASLGVVPDYTTDESSTKGVKIAGTSPGSPAEGIGLREGDVLVGFNDKALDNLVDLSVALKSAKPGDKIKLRVQRNGQPMTFDVTLAERK
jgi:hypothetical protein